MTTATPASIASSSSSTTATTASSRTLWIGSNLSINFSPSRPIVRSYPASPTAASASSSASSMFPHYSSRARDGIHSLSPAAPRSGYNLRSAYSWSIPRHFDFELALSQLRRLLVNPKSVYQDIYFHKRPNQKSWHRDDPAFTLSLAGLFTFPRLLGLTLRMLLVDYLLVGFAVAAGITARVVGNAVYGLAWVSMFSLPFLMHPEYVLYLLAVLAIVWLTA
ncbi:hypothetical protein BCR44DRAFT_1429959 [Catenaria anguillulae PL171]|uniref:Uncharacterized protein n=1 Tax=Catenaria anguillulae PL171 TaxID=765915 RepID=A0A1Y2HTE6_9FUNG|nr:hypothetical protein BCR44DRAFT_1429959 [Catenaria anguillulae PL171]